MMIKIILGIIVIIIIFVCVSINTENTKSVEIGIIIDDKPPIIMGIIPYLTVDELKKQMKPFADYLAIKLDRRVELNIASDYETLGKLIDSGRVDFTWFSHASYMKLSKGKDWEVICRPLVNGKNFYQGLILVDKNSKYTKIEDLKNKNFAYVDRNSGSGFLYPNIYFKKKKIVPLKFFKNIAFSRSHDTSVQGILTGKYDAAAVFDGLLISEEQNSKVRVICTTGWIPNDPIVISKEIDPLFKKKLLEALLNMDNDKDGKILLEKLKILRGIVKFVPEKIIQKNLKEILEKTENSNKKN